MNGGVPAAKSIGRRVTEEFKEFLVIAAYLYVCFTALAYLKAAILQAHGIAFAPFGFAAVKAVICAKFMTIGHALRMGERYKNRALIWPTLCRSLVFLALLIVLSLLEEVVTGMIHRQTLKDSISNFGGGTLDQLIATSIVVLLILIPFFAFRTLGEIVGEANLVRVFLHGRAATDDA
ncbi:MAG: hypothetical protein WA776_21875 [Xanthobacteraceae bacterium]